MTDTATAEGIAKFAARYPRAWHVIEPEGAACDILYPAATLRDFAGLADDTANRDGCQHLALPEGKAAVLRAQLMWDARLTPTLRGDFSGRPELWRGHIDRHVFFWVTSDRRDRFIDACIRSRKQDVARGERPPVVIEIDTASLLAAHHAAAYFAMINTGSTILGGGRTRRDEATFRPVQGWRGERAAELAIRAPVPLMPRAGNAVLARYAAAASDSRLASTRRQSSSASMK